MHEVDLGSRAGKPALLLSLAAIALIGAVGAAWWQTHDKRRLDTPRMLADSPLRIRPPRGWHEDPKRPGTFMLLDAAALKVQEIAIERRVTFRYERRREFVAPDVIIRQRDAADRAESSASEPARLAGLPAREVQRVRRFQYRNQMHRQVALLRVACSPWGDVIQVEYWPMTELTPADLRMIDDICNAVELRGARVMGARPSDLAANVGVKLPQKLPGELLPPEDAETRGLYVTLGSSDSISCIGLHRTWLAPGREPADLLVDFVDHYWGMPDDRPIVSEWGRPDRCNVACVRMRLPGTPRRSALAAYLLWRNPAHVVLAHLNHDAALRPQSAEEFQSFVNELDLVDPGTSFDVAAARSAGKALIQECTSSAVMQAWAARPRQALYLDVDPGALAARIDQSESRNIAGAAGLVGASAVWIDAGRRFATSVWSADARGDRFEFARRFGVAESVRSASSLLITDKRESPGGVVHRRVQRGLTVSHDGSVTVDDSFLAPPLDLAAATVVSRAKKGTWLIERLAPRRAGTAGRMLFAAAPDESGRARVVAIDDFAPWAQVLTFESDFSPTAIRTRADHWREAPDTWQRRAEYAEVVRRATELLRD